MSAICAGLVASCRKSALARGEATNEPKDSPIIPCCHPSWPFSPPIFFTFLISQGNERCRNGRTQGFLFWCCCQKHKNSGRGYLLSVERHTFISACSSRQWAPARHGCSQISRMRFRNTRTAPHILLKVGLRPGGAEPWPSGAEDVTWSSDI